MSHRHEEGTCITHRTIRTWSYIEHFLPFIVENTATICTGLDFTADAYTL